jgi:hypothetical protein
LPKKHWLTIPTIYAMLLFAEVVYTKSPFDSSFVVQTVVTLKGLIALYIKDRLDHSFKHKVILI